MEMKFKPERAVPSLFILTFMASLGPFGDTEYTPSLPSIASFLEISYGQAQLTMTVYLFGFGFSQIFYGPLSDRLGRRPVVLFGISTFLVGSLLCSFSSTLNMLLVGRFIQSLGACAGGVISNAAIRDAFPLNRQTRVFLQVNTALSLAPGIGPIAGSLIDHYLFWQANFYLLAILAVLLLFSLFFAFPETNFNRDVNATRPRHFFRNYQMLFKHPGYVYYAILSGLCFGAIYCSLVEAPHLILIELGYPASTFVIVAVCIVSGFVLGASSCAYLGRFLHDPQLIIIGLLIMLFASLTIGYFSYQEWITLTNMLAAIATLYIGLAFVIPVATARALAPFGRNAGSASSMFGCFSMGLAAVSTYFISELPNDSPDALFITFTLLTGLSLILTLITHLFWPSKL